MASSGRDRDADVTPDLDGASAEELVRVVIGARAPARLLLDRFGGLAGLARATAEEIDAWLATQGARKGSAQALAAAFELGRRAACERAPPPLVSSSKEAAEWAVPRLSMLDHEELWLLALDGRSRLRATRCVARGGLHGLSVRPADALRLALRASASGFVLVHNHPSGDPSPSVEDVTFTQRVAAAAAVAGVPLLDHVIVTRDGFSSVPLPAEDGAEA